MTKSFMKSTVSSRAHAGQGPSPVRRSPRRSNGNRNRRGAAVRPSPSNRNLRNRRGSNRPAVPVQRRRSARIRQLQARQGRDQPEADREAVEAPEDPSNLGHHDEVDIVAAPSVEVEVQAVPVVELNLIVVPFSGVDSGLPAVGIVPDPTVYENVPSENGRDAVRAYHDQDVSSDVAVSDVSLQGNNQGNGQVVSHVDVSAIPEVAQADVSSPCAHDFPRDRSGPADQQSVPQAAAEPATTRMSLTHQFSFSASSRGRPTRAMSELVGQSPSARTFIISRNVEPSPPQGTYTVRRGGPPEFGNFGTRLADFYSQMSDTRTSLSSSGSLSLISELIRTQRRQNDPACPNCGVNLSSFIAGYISGLQANQTMTDNRTSSNIGSHSTQARTLDTVVAQQDSNVDEDSAARVASVDDGHGNVDVEAEENSTGNVPRD
ncbi:unnamed protein product [Caenorhabditis auriculariae]|uniref:Uncharacterized protein n=1 Tax=Caenorhabditis auriculariae TaxID=2777116 RepID=A0A8S1H6Y0_9PELO|nr:unnamed protein product [Caenorhabditis auriculariae]